MGITRETFGKRRALHVDDEEEHREIIAVLLEDEGYSVIQTDNVQDAEIIVRKELESGKPFDLYVSDGEFYLELGGIREREAGLILYDRIKNLIHGRPYVVVSSNLQLRTRCRERGIKFIVKTDVTERFPEYLKGLQ